MEHGANLFEAAEVRQLISAAGPQRKATFYPGINGGFGNTDCPTLPCSALDFDGGWLNFPRPKTFAFDHSVKPALRIVG